MNWSKGIKIGLGVLIAGSFIAYGILSYAYQPHETIEEQEINFEGTATAFTEEVIAEPGKWTNTIVLLQGVLTSHDEEGFMLNGKVYCQHKDATTASELMDDATLQIKGRFIGYDDLLEEIKLDQCIVLSQE